MSLTLTSSRGTEWSPSRGARMVGTLLVTVAAFGATRIVTSRGDDALVPRRSTEPAAQLADLEARIAAIRTLMVPSTRHSSMPANWSHSRFSIGRPAVSRRVLVK